MKRTIWLIPLVSAVAFVLATLGVGSKSGLASIDQSVWRLFSAHSSPGFESLARQLTQLGGMGFLVPLSVLFAGWIAWTRHSLVMAVVPWLSLQASSFAVRSSKVHFAVERPPVGAQVVRTLSPSFPSGHVGNTTGLVVATAMVVGMTSPSRTVRAAAGGGAGVVAMVMAWTRLELNVHWLSDVIGGACLGTAVGSAVGLIAVSLVGRSGDETRSVATVQD